MAINRFAIPYRRNYPWICLTGKDRVEWTPKIDPIDIEEPYIFDLTEVRSCTRRVYGGETPRPFIRCQCDECGRISNRIRTGKFNWPWSGDVTTNISGDLIARGKRIKEKYSGVKFGYCPKCLFDTAKLCQAAWESDDLRRTINSTLRDIQNVKNENNRSTSSVFG